MSVIFAILATSLSLIPACMVHAHKYPTGILDSAEAQVKGNLNEWVCMDMNEC